MEFIQLVEHYDGPEGSLHGIVHARKFVFHARDLNFTHAKKSSRT